MHERAGCFRNTHNEVGNGYLGEDRGDEGDAGSCFIAASRESGICTSLLLFVLWLVIQDLLIGVA